MSDYGMSKEEIADNFGVFSKKFVKYTIDSMIDVYKRDVEKAEKKGKNDVCSKSNITTLNILKFKLGLD